ncbi:complement C1q tumor necrosis factor-related protein 4-like [Ptychodera flava]|uniref:complement C1q tumor necrosis factor-related protein 4-like n=1 Tax=Ptychodera flava TaxID=63121 RepID=UPI00396A8DF7
MSIRYLLAGIVFSLMVSEGALKDTDGVPQSPFTGCLPCCMKGDTGPPGPPGPPVQRKVAFSVARTTGMTSNPSQQVVIFDHVFTNVGNGYDANTGFFTCPVSGTYFIAFNALKYYNRNLHVKLMKNNTEVIAAHSGMGSGTAGPSELANTGNDVIIPCKEGDRLWIKLSYASGHTFQFFSHPTHKYTSFSGYMIFDN